jgi:hypothetical protein
MALSSNLLVLLGEHSRFRTLLVMGFPPHHRFPQWNPKPRLHPPRRGFSYEGLGTSVSSGEGGLGVRSGPFGCTSVAAALLRVFGSVPGSSHLQSGENNPQRNFIRLMALTSQTLRETWLVIAIAARDCESRCSRFCPSTHKFGLSMQSEIAILIICQSDF